MPCGISLSCISREKKYGIVSCDDRCLRDIITIKRLHFEEVV